VLSEFAQNTAITFSSTGDSVTVVQLDYLESLQKLLALRAEYLRLYNRGVKEMVSWIKY
jgi:hypothetical protein